MKEAKHKSEKTKKIKTKFPGVFYYELADGDKSFVILYKNPLDQKLHEDKIGKYSEGIRADYCFNKRAEVLHKLRHGDELPQTARKLRLERGGKTFDEIFELYKTARSDKSSLREDIGVYNHHLKAKIGHLPMFQISTELLEKIRSELKPVKQGVSELSDKSKNNVIATVRQVFNFAIEREIIKQVKNPVDNIQMLEVDNAREVFLTYEQADTLLYYMQCAKNKRLYQLTVFLLDTGARFSEVASRTWSDINTDSMTIYFPSTKDGNARWIAISKRLEAVLEDLRGEQNESRYIVPNNKGGQLQQMPDQWQTITDEVIKGNKKAPSNLRITPHSLRHTHASWLAMAGLDIMHIKDQLGHKTLEMVIRYSHLIPNKRHEVTRKFFKSKKEIDLDKKNKQNED